ncbi:Putative odorant receptor 67a [Atta colombica]|uniref:Odorant receptor n=1 Tax=Atta colombica TaxID=520822 RepID=A0A195BMD6_9HYME|nr:Putative odorant receptor 67a [Atta colombica]
MQEYCLSPKSDEETKIQNLHAQHGRKLGYAYTGFLLSHSVLYLLATLLSRVLYVKSEETDETSNNVQRGLPFRINSMIDLDTYYVPIFIHCSICEFMYMFLLTVIDVLYLTMVEYCCGLFAALRYRLETALVFENERLTVIFTEDKSYVNIVYSIRRHTEVLQFIAIVESIYSLPLFIQIALTVLLLSLLGYQIVNNMENVSGDINNYVYLNGLLLNVLFENWQGQKIIDSSEKVFKSAYNTKWYNMPVAARKLLIMIMMRSEKPSTLKLGKVIVLSYVTFNAVNFHYFYNIQKSLNDLYIYFNIFKNYRGEWYESSPKSRKLLNMIMLRSISPCTLTVGKIMILSFPSFSAVKLDIIFFDYIHRRFLYFGQS